MRGALYVLFLNNDATVSSYQKISETYGGFTGVLNNEDVFGSTLAYLGDMNGDGLIEVGVGAEWDFSGGYRSGAAWILSLNTNGTVSSSVKITEFTSGFNVNLQVWDVFGSDIERIGDFNCDGNEDIIISARRDKNGGSDRGALYVLFLDSNFTVLSYQKISNTSGGLGNIINDQDYFGASVANIGDLDNDGVIDIAVGAYRDDDGGTNNGAVYILF